MLKRTYDAVEMYLSENGKEALDLARQMNSEDGSFEWCDVWDWDELCEIAAEGGADAVDDLVRAAVNGDTYGCQVRYDGYGNLEPGEENDLLNDALDYLKDIVNVFADYVDDDGYVNTLIISDELQEIIDESVIAKVHVTDIVYDITEEDELTPEDIAAMPKELDLEINMEEEGIDEDELADLISDETGWCIISYNYTIKEA